MLFSPTNLNPDAVAIDATITNTFSWKNNGKDITGYRLYIYLNSTSAQVYDSGLVQTSNSTHNLVAGTLTNNQDYKWKVVSHTANDSAESEYVFLKTYKKPVITVTVPDSPNTISSTTYTFSADYSQDQNIPYNKYRFILYDSNDEILDQSEWAYDYNMTFTFDGFENNKTYKIECIVECPYSMNSTSGKKPFFVSYILPTTINVLELTSNDEKGNVLLNWSEIKEVFAEVTGTYSYVTGKFGLGVQVDDESKITYNEIFPQDGTLNLWVKNPTGFVGDILSLGNNQLILGYSGTRFYCKVNGESLFSLPITLPNDFYKIAIISNKILIQTDTQTEIFGG